MTLYINKHNTALFVPTKIEAEKLFNINKFEYNDISLPHANWRGYNIYVSGFGKVNTAYSITRYLSQFMVYTSSMNNDLDATQQFNDKNIVMLGVAGAYRDSNLQIGNIGIVASETFVDEALITYEDDSYSLATTDEIGFSISEKNRILLSTNLVNTLHKTPIKLPILHSNTVSLLTGVDDLSNLFHSKSKADIENMEGAAFAYVAEKFAIKAAEIRAISNYCGSRENQMWNIDKATNTLRNFLENNFQ